MPQLPRPVNDPTSAACYVKYHSSNRWRRRWRRPRRPAQIGFTRSSSTAGGLRSMSKAALPRSTVRTGPTTRNDFEPCARGHSGKSAIIDCELVAVTRPVCRAFVRSWNSETRRRGFASGASISFRSTGPGSRRCRFRCPTGMRRINRAAWIIRGKSELDQELPSFKDFKLSADIDLPPRNFGHQASPSRTPSALSRPAPAV